MEIKISPVASSVAQSSPKKTSAIAGYGNYSRSPKINLIVVRQDLQLLMKNKMTPDGGTPLGSIFAGRRGWGGNIDVQL